MSLWLTDSDEEQWRHVARASRRAVTRVISTFPCPKSRDGSPLRRPRGPRDKGGKGAKPSPFFNGAV